MATHATHPEVTVEELEADCTAAETMFLSRERCFSHVTVRFLLDVIEEQRQSIAAMQFALEMVVKQAND